MNQDHELAWELATFAQPRLDDAQRHRLFIAIGTHELFTAIQLALDAIVRHDIALTSETVRRLGLWLDRYAGHIDESILRRRISRIRILPRDRSLPHQLHLQSSYLSVAQRYSRGHLTIERGR